MKRIRAVLADLADGALAYFCTLAGVLLAQFAPYLASRGRVDPSLVLDVLRIGISALVALYIVAQQEGVPDEDDPKAQIAKAGKRRNFRQRMANAFAHGVAWNTLIGIGTGAAQ